MRDVDKRADPSHVPPADVGILWSGRSLTPPTASHVTCRWFPSLAKCRAALGLLWLDGRKANDQALERRARSHKHVPVGSQTSDTTTSSRGRVEGALLLASAHREETNALEPIPTAQDEMEEGGCGGCWPPSWRPRRKRNLRPSWNGRLHHRRAIAPSGGR